MLIKLLYYLYKLLAYNKNDYLVLFITILIIFLKYVFKIKLYLKHILK